MASLRNAESRSRGLPCSDLKASGLADPRDFLIIMWGGQKKKKINILRKIGVWEDVPLIHDHSPESSAVHERVSGPYSKRSFRYSAGRPGTSSRAPRPLKGNARYLAGYPAKSKSGSPKTS